jgi:hypothetical protein
MDSKNRGLRVASVVFGLVSLAQLTRVVMHLEVMAGGRRIPFWPSVAAFVITGTLSLWLWKLSQD